MELKMEFSEAITALADRAQKVRSSLKTEEATKTALVLPFIQVLGYDVFNPLEVVPEYIADIAGRKGDKVDYAIMQADKPIMIIECKCCGANLDEIKAGQLHSYFLALDSKIGILTDGIRYLFFSSDKDDKHMDTKPFMEFSLDNVDPVLLPELRKLCKGKFDLETTLSTVHKLKYTRQIKLLLARNLETPEEKFIRYFMKEADVWGSAKMKERFAEYVKSAFTEFITEQAVGKVKDAFAPTTKKEEEAEPLLLPVIPEPEFTENERLAFYIVKFLLMGTVDPERIFLRSMIGLGRSTVILDDTIRMPLLRLNFNKPEKLSIGVIGEDRTDNWIVIEKLDDILQHAEAIRATAQAYDATKAKK